MFCVDGVKLYTDLSSQNVACKSLCKPRPSQTVLTFGLEWPYLYINMVIDSILITNILLSPKMDVIKH